MPIHAQKLWEHYWRKMQNNNKAPSNNGEVAESSEEKRTGKEQENRNSLEYLSKAKPQGSGKAAGVRFRI